MAALYARTGTRTISRDSRSLSSSQLARKKGERARNTLRRNLYQFLVQVLHGRKRQIENACDLPTNGVKTEKFIDKKETRYKGLSVSLDSQVVTSEQRHVSSSVPQKDVGT